LRRLSGRVGTHTGRASSRRDRQCVGGAEAWRESFHPHPASALSGAFETARSRQNADRGPGAVGGRPFARRRGLRPSVGPFPFVCPAPAAGRLSVRRVGKARRQLPSGAPPLLAARLATPQTGGFTSLTMAKPILLYFYVKRSTFI